MIRTGSVHRMQALSGELRSRGEKTGFVPTMGFLHEGHLSLIRKSLKECSQTFVSIFVNPIQFGPDEDYDRYPRDMKHDVRIVKELGVDVLFTPSAEHLYPEGFATSVTVDTISTVGEGASRPSHFRGVTTIVAKLLNIVHPSVLYLGQKDIQQAVILKRMIRDLNFPTSVRICPTRRERDGLAMSSRNAYLSQSERLSARALITALRSAESAVRSGERNCGSIARKMKTVYRRFPGIRPDYILFADFESFAPVTHIERRTIIATAAFAGKTRLIDNVIVTPPRNDG